MRDADTAGRRRGVPAASRAPPPLDAGREVPETREAVPARAFHNAGEGAASPQPPGPRIPDAPAGRAARPLI